MAVNAKGPYEVRIPYISPDGYTHTLRLNAIVAGAAPEPGTDPDDVILVTRGGSVSLSAGVNALWAIFRPRITPTTLASGFSFWKIPTGGGDPLFITAGDLTTPNGSSINAFRPNGQEIWTFRSAAGGIAKLVVMDAANPNNNRTPIPPADPIATYMTGATSWVIARDDGYLIAPINVSVGENERLFKARNRK